MTELKTFMQRRLKFLIDNCFRNLILLDKIRSSQLFSNYFSSLEKNLYNLKMI